MSPRRRTGPPPPSDPDAGVWQGEVVARRATSPDGWTVLVGTGARQNDILTLKLAAQTDFWLHVAAGSGSHVVVRNPDAADRMPRETQRFAAGLAVGYSKARRGGRSAVHLARVRDVSKPRGLAPGKVVLGRYSTVQANPVRLDDEG